MTGYDMTCDAFTDSLADYLEGDLPDAAHEAMEAHAACCDSCGAMLADLLSISQHATALPPLEPSRDLWSGIAERIDATVLPMAPARREFAVPSIRRGWNRPTVAAAALVLFTAGVTHVLTRASLAPSASVVATSLPTHTHTIPADSLPTAARQVASATPDREVIQADLSAPTRDARPARRTASTSGDATSAMAAPRSSATAGRGAVVRLARAEPLLQPVEPVYDREITKLRTIVRERHSQLDPRTIAVLEQSVAVIDSAIAQSRAALARDPASGFLATQLNHSLEKKVELLRTAASLPART